MKSKRLETTSISNKYGLKKWAIIMILLTFYSIPQSLNWSVDIRHVNYGLKEVMMILRGSASYWAALSWELYNRNTQKGHLGNQYEEKSSTMSGLHFCLILVCNTHVLPQCSWLMQYSQVRGGCQDTWKLMYRC